MISTDFSPEYYQEMARAGLREAARRADLVRRRLYLCGKLVRGAAGPKHLVFHRDQRSGRQLIGANRAAKTTTGVVEARWWLEGTHPYRKTPPPPVFGRLVCPQLPGPEDKKHAQREAIIEWFPPHLLRGGSWSEAYSIAGHTLHLGNGSFLEILSSEQQTDTHAGASRHFCLDRDTTILSEHGWTGPTDLREGDLIYTYHAASGVMEWKPVRFIYRAPHAGRMVRMVRTAKNGRRAFDALVTPEHRWPVVNLNTRLVEWRTTDTLKTHHAILRAASPGWERIEVYDDAFVRLVAWTLTEGHVHRRNRQIRISQVTPSYVAALRELVVVGGHGRQFATVDREGRACQQFDLHGEMRRRIYALIGPDKRVPMTFVTALSRRQLQLFYETLLDGDGTRRTDRTVFTQKTRPHIAETFEAVCALLGKATRTHREPNGTVRVWVQTGQRFGPRVRIANVQRRDTDYNGEVWCPNTENGTVVARRNGVVFITGNCWFDEELPRDIWAENVARLAVGEWSGAWWLTMTPIEGLLWIEQEIYKAGLEGAAPFGVHEVTIWDNAHNLPKGFIEQFSESLLPMEREVRLKGKYGQRSGLIYDLFSGAHVGEFGIEQEGE